MGKPDDEAERFVRRLNRWGAAYGTVEKAPQCGKTTVIPAKAGIHFMILLSFSHLIPARGRSAALESGKDEAGIWRRPYLPRSGERTSGRKAKDKGENRFRRTLIHQSGSTSRIGRLRHRNDEQRRRSVPGEARLFQQPPLSGVKRSFLGAVEKAGEGL